MIFVGACFAPPMLWEKPPSAKPDHEQQECMFSITPLQYYPHFAPLEGYSWQPQVSDDYAPGLDSCFNIPEF